MAKNDDLKRRYSIYSAYDDSQNNNTNFVGTMSSAASDNPYASALSAGAYKNKRDAKKLFNSSLEYEASLSQYERQLSDQERLTREQRAYDSPAAQRQRMLEAGINPDLAAGSGSGSGSGSSGSVSAPAMNGTTLEDFTDPVQDFVNVAGGVSSVIGSLSGVVDIARQVSTFSDALRLSSVAADSAEMEGLSKRIGTFGDIASMMTPKVDSAGAVQPFTSEDVASFLQTNGLKDSDGSLAAGVASYSGSPAMQKYYSDSILASRKAKADLITQPFEALREFADNSFKVSQLQQDCALISAQFQKWFDSFSKTQDAAQLMAGTAGQRLINDAAEASFDHQKITRDLEVFARRLKALAGMGSSMRSRIDQLRKLPRTTTVSSAIIALESSYTRIMNAGSDELGKIFDLRRLFEKSFYDADRFIYSGTGNITPGEREFSDRYFAFSDLVLSPSQSATTSASDPLDSLVSLITSYLTKGKR